jgi:1-deoxy-D-xylulose-5-phosphate synthase
MDHGLRLRTMTLPDRFIEQASPTAMYADAGMSVANIIRTVHSVVPQRVTALRA